MCFTKYLRIHVTSLQILKFILISLITFMYFVKGEPTPQNKSMLKYMNPKYVRDVNVTMYRRKKSDPFGTNVTVTTFHTWGNNVTMLISYPTEGGKEFKINMRLCDLADKLWVVELFRLHSNSSDCPQAAGTYRFYNLVTLPKGLPAPVATPPKSSTGFANVLYYLTGTKEKMFGFQLLLRYRSSV